MADIFSDSRFAEAEILLGVDLRPEHRQLREHRGRQTLDAHHRGAAEVRGQADLGAADRRRRRKAHRHLRKIRRHRESPFAGLRIDHIGSNKTRKFPVTFGEKENC